MEDIKIGIALSGGGALGASHAGVLKALDEAGIKPHHITGVSAGAVIGSLYCSGNTPDKILKLFDIKSLFELFNLKSFTSGLVDTEYFRKIIRNNSEDDTFASLKTKLSIGATNLNTGAYEIFEKGPLSIAAGASMSVPLLMKPVKIGEHTYIDGGLINNLLVSPLLETCDFVIGINAHYHKSLEKIDGLKGVAKRCFEIIAWSSVRENGKKCDFLMEVEGTNKYPLFDFDSSKEIFTIGYEEMKNKIPELEKQLSKKR